MMKKIVVLLCGLLLTWNVCAKEVAGVKLLETDKVGSVILKLNGAGIRSKMFFKVYVGALYLPQKQTSAEAIIADERERRVALFILRELSSEKLLGAFIEAIEANHSKSELAALDAQLKQMAQIFDSMKVVKTGDVITLDYQPAFGTQIGVNGVVRGTVSGAPLYRALLRIWLGNNPVQDDLKKEMLGG